MRARFVLPLLWSLLAACGFSGSERGERIERTGSHEQPIVNGAVSSADQDFVVQLGLDRGGIVHPSCSGTMVAKSLVLTARHCVGQLHGDATVEDFAPSEIHVYSGADAPQRLHAGGRADARGKLLFTAPTKHLVPDVALVLLDKALDIPIAAIRLEGGAKKNELLDIIGFGINEKNEHPELRMQRKSVRVLDIGPGFTLHHELFDGEFVLGEAACSGDSGGPAVSSTTKAVVGVASRVSNGEERTEEDPSAFCLGASAEDVYSALEPVKDVILEAFATAGAKPILEEAEEPPPPDAGAAAPSPQAEEPIAPAPVITRTTTTTGCSAAPSTSGPTGAAMLAALLGLAALVGRTRRA
jgi:uncharacterized protein (TIGR03382 family)